MPQQGIIKRVLVSVLVNGLELQRTPEDYRIKINCEVEYIRYENDKYYDVPLSSRWKFGISYAVLACVLIGLMYSVHIVGNINV